VCCSVVTLIGLCGQREVLEALRVAVEKQLAAEDILSVLQVALS
jgi:hypothetical protein